MASIGRIWNVVSLLALLDLTKGSVCEEKFEISHEPRHMKFSNCESKALETGHTLNTCKAHACDLDGNTINYRDGGCDVRDCSNGDMKISSVQDEWTVLVIPDLLQRSPLQVLDFDHSVGQCTAGGYPEEQAPHWIHTGFLYLLLDYEFSCEGDVAAWMYFAKTTGTFYGCAFRPRRADSKISWVGCNPLTADVTGTQVDEMPLNGRFHVEPGDIIGIVYNGPNPSQVLSVDVRPTARPKVNPTAVYFIYGVRRPDLTLTWERSLPKSTPIMKFSFGIQAQVVGPPVNLRLTGGPDRGRIGRAEILKSKAGEGDELPPTFFHRYHYYGWPNLFCKAIGYPTSVKAFYTSQVDSFNLPDDLPIHEMSPRCKPSTNHSIFACDVHPKGQCEHYEDLYVKCERRLKLLGGNNNRCRGIPAIWEGHYWGTVCDGVNSPDWHKQNLEYSWTTAFCQELGCSGRAYYINYARWTLDNYIPTLHPNYPSPRCAVPYPTEMWECPKQNAYECTNFEDFYLECD